MRPYLALGILGVLGCADYSEEVFITDIACRVSEDCAAGERCNVVLGRCTMTPRASAGEACDLRSCQDGLSCLSAAQDPSGIATCREACAAGQTCAEATFRCITADSGEVCVPPGIPGAACTADPDCAAGALCIEGEPGAPTALRCRQVCDVDVGTPGCLGPTFCFERMDRGVCLVDPCSVLSCEPGTACERDTILVAECRPAGRASGTFSTELSTSADPSFGPSSGEISAPGVAAFSPSDGAFATLTQVDGTEYLLVALYGAPSTSGFEALLLGAPTNGLRTGEGVVVGIAGIAELRFVPSDGGAEVSQAIGASGTFTFSAVTRALGQPVSGSFDLWLTQPTP